MNERPPRKLRRRAPPRLPAPARWTLRGLVTLPLLSLAVASGFYLRSVYHLLRANLVPIAESEATRQTGHEVRIGGADFGKRGVLVLTNVAIANKATFAAGHGEATLSARRLTVDYNLHDLLFDSGNAAHAIGDVTLDQPTVLVERFSSGYNFSDLLQPKSTKKSKPFVGRIIVHRGLLRFRDYQAPANVGYRPALNTLTNVEGKVDLSSERTVYFDVRGRGTGVRFASLAVSGDVSRQGTGRYRGHVIAVDADAAYWAAYFKEFPQARIIAGRADADVSLAKLASRPAPGQPLDLSGHVAVRHVSILAANKKILAQPLQDLNGAASFTGAGLSIDANALLAGQRLLVAGTVFDFASPQIAFSASSPRLDPARLADALPFLKLPPGIKVSPGPVAADFTGTPSDPTITVRATLPAVVYEGNQATNLVAQASYASKILSVPTATFRLNGTGQVALRGTADFSRAKPVLLLAGTARDVSLAALRFPPGVNAKVFNLGGVADAQFLADNQNRPLSVVANVSANGLRVRRTALRSVVGRVSWTQGQPLVITRAVARDPNGTAVVSGLAPVGTPSGRWDLNVRTAGLDLAGLLRPYSQAALGGRADFEGRVVGPADAPQAVGAVRLAEPRFGRYGADLVTGRMTASTAGVGLQDVIVRRFPAEARLSGTVTALAGGDPKLDIGVRLSQGDVRDFLQLAEQASAPAPKTKKTLTASLPNLTGTAAATFQVTGRLKSPIVAGHAEVADVTVGGYRLDQVAGDVRYAAGIVRLDNGLVKSGTATLTVRGSRTAAGVLSAGFAATGLDLTRFHALFDAYADVTGTASFSGRFGGTPASPHVALTALELPDLVVDGQKFAPLSLAGRYDDGVLTQTGAPWRLTLQPLPDYAGEVNRPVVYQMDRLRLVLPTTTHSKRPTTLAMAGAIPAVTPERISHVLGTIRGSRYARTPAGRDLLARLDRLPQPLSGTFALPSFEVSGPLDALAAQAELTASDLVVGETRVGGLSAKGDYTGGKNPSGQVSAQAQNVLVGGVPIGTATADADFRNRIVTLRGLKANSERAFLSASGTANLDGDVAASLDASNIPLALLGTAFPPAARFLPALPREISDLSVSASGPTKAPNLVGSVSLSNPEGGAGADTPAYALDRIRSGAITLAPVAPGGPRVLTVNDLSAYKGGRLVATLTGSLPFPLGDLMKPDAAGATAGDDDDLHATLKVQDLSALALFSPVLIDPKKTGGQLSASASFGGGRLSGLVSVTGASLGLTSFDTGVNKITGIVVLADNKARIQNFSGQSTKGGTFALSGGGGLTLAADGTQDGTLDLRLTAKDLTVDENSKKNVLYEKFSSGARAKINGTLTVAGHWLTPTISTASGSPLVVSDATGTLPSPSGKATTAGEPPSFDPLLDVAVYLGGGRSKTVSVRSALLKADASGLVQLSGRLSDPRLRANVAVARGQFSLPPTVLKIVKPSDGEGNTVSVNYPVVGLDGLPGVETRVNLTAQATVSLSPQALSQNRSINSEAAVGEAAPQEALSPTFGQFGGGTQRYTITATIRGVLNSPDNLDLKLTSSPGGLTRQQMLAALVPYGSLLAPGGPGAGNALEDQVKMAVSSLLLSPVTDAIGSALGLGDLDVNYVPELGALVTLTKQIGPRLQVTYTRSVGARTPGAVNSTLSPPQYTLKLGYNLTNHLQAGVSTDDQRNDTVTLEGVFGF